MIEHTPITRRRLLALGGTAAAAASVPGIVRPARAAAAGSWLAHASYRNRIGEVFSMTLADGSRLGMKLWAVHGDNRSFDLVFHPTSSVVHPQATRTFTHAALGKTQLFVVPFAAPGTRLKYVVSINRSR